jgi:hypothetical protein
VKLGAENRTKVVAAGVLLVLALVLCSRFLFSGSAQPVAAAPAGITAPPPAPAARPAKAGARKSSLQLSAMDPRLRFDWLRASEGTKYEGRNRNIFVSTDVPEPQTNGTTDRVAKAEPPPLPPGPTVIPPPPINLKFYGFASSSGEKKIFLSEGEDIFIAKENDIVDRRYKILRISPNSVEVEDVLNNNRQQIPLIQGG